MLEKKILLYPNKKLKIKSKKVKKINSYVNHIIKKMHNIMYKANGIGLAAIQIGINLKIVVIDINLNNKKSIVLINPRIINFNGIQISNEACLSFPGINVQILRHKYVKIKYTNELGKICYVEATDIMSRCLQHEMDHLNGLTIFDHISSFKKKRVESKLCV